MELLMSVLIVLESNLQPDFQDKDKSRQTSKEAFADFKTMRFS